MAEVKKVRVKLAARCWVDEVVCEKGDIVLMPADLAPKFGEVQGEPKAFKESEVKIREDK